MFESTMKPEFDDYCSDKAEYVVNEQLNRPKQRYALDLDLWRCVFMH